MKLVNHFGFNFDRQDNLWPLSSEPKFFLSCVDNVAKIICVGEGAQGRSLQTLPFFTPTYEIISASDTLVTESNCFIALAGENFAKEGSPNIFLYSFDPFISAEEDNFCSLELSQCGNLTNGTENKYSAVKFYSNEQSLASVGDFPDFWLAVWDWRKETVILRTKGFSQTIFKVLFFPTNAGILCTSGLGHIKFWKMADTFTGLKLQGEVGKFGAVEMSDIVAFDFLPDGKILSGSESGSLLLWEGQFIKLEFRRKQGDGESELPHFGMVTVVIVSVSQSIIYTCAADSSLNIWRLEDIEDANLADNEEFCFVKELSNIKVGTSLTKSSFFSNLVLFGSENFVSVFGSTPEGSLYQVSSEKGADLAMPFKVKLQQISHGFPGKIIAARYLNDFTLSEDQVVVKKCHAFLAHENGFLSIVEYEKSKVLDVVHLSQGSPSALCLSEDRIYVGFSVGAVIAFRYQDSSLHVLKGVFKPHEETVNGIKCFQETMGTEMLLVSCAMEVCFSKVEAVTESITFTPLFVVKAQYIGVFKPPAAQSLFCLRSSEVELNSSNLEGERETKLICIDAISKACSLVPAGSYSVSLSSLVKESRETSLDNGKKTELVARIKGLRGIQTCAGVQIPLEAILFTLIECFVIYDHPKLGAECKKVFSLSPDSGYTILFVEHAGDTLLLESSDGHVYLIELKQSEGFVEGETIGIYASNFGNALRSMSLYQPKLNYPFKYFSFASFNGAVSLYEYFETKDALSALGCMAQTKFKHHTSSNMVALPNLENISFPETTIEKCKSNEYKQQMYEASEAKKKETRYNIHRLQMEFGRVKARYSHIFHSAPEHFEINTDLKHLRVFQLREAKREVENILRFDLHLAKQLYKKLKSAFFSHITAISRADSKIPIFSNSLGITIPDTQVSSSWGKISTSLWSTSEVLRSLNESGNPLHQTLSIQEEADAVCGTHSVTGWELRRVMRRKRKKKKIALLEARPDSFLSVEEKDNIREVVHSQIGTCNLALENNHKVIPQDFVSLQEKQSVLSSKKSTTLKAKRELIAAFGSSAARNSEDDSVWRRERVSTSRNFARDAFREILLMRQIHVLMPFQKKLDQVFSRYEQNEKDVTKVEGQLREGEDELTILKEEGSKHEIILGEINSSFKDLCEGMRAHFQKSKTISTEDVIFSMTKIFRKKIKTKVVKPEVLDAAEEKSGGSAGSSEDSSEEDEPSSSEEETSESEEEEESDEAPGKKKGLNKSDIEFLIRAPRYLDLLSLREERQSTENSIAEVEKNIVEVRTSLDRTKANLNQLKKERLNIKMEFQKIETEKLLLTNNAFCIEPCELRSINNVASVTQENVPSLIFISESKFVGLSEKVNTICRENSTAKNSMKDMLKQLTGLKFSKRQQVKEIQELKEKCCAIQILKFGKIIDLDKVDKIEEVKKRNVEVLESRMKHEQIFFNRKHSAVDQEIKQLKQTLLEFTRVNSKLLNEQVSLLRRQETIRKRSSLACRERSSDVVMPAEPDVESLASKVEHNIKKITTLEEEIARTSLQV
eukprot:snap_masked-scaffold_43-processed-gene-1.105-mRNA-1 protein AED:0.40 eAED:0.43 QI:0/-1/0/1/-1/1/1/0/1531